MEIIKFKNILLNIPKRYYNEDLKNRFNKDNYETNELYFVNKYFDKNDYVLELGSCLGFISFILAKNVKHVISIEANPELENCLLSSQKMNSINNIDFHNCFISNDTKNITFQTYDLIIAGSGNRTKESVGTYINTLKEYELTPRKLNSIENINKVNCLVLSIEGGELNFLSENNDFLKKCNKVFAEFHQRLMDIPDFEKKCINLLKSYDFILKEAKGYNFYFEKKSFVNLKLKPEKNTEEKPNKNPEEKHNKNPEEKLVKKTVKKLVKKPVKTEEKNQLLNLLLRNAKKIKNL